MSTVSPAPSPLPSPAASPVAASFPSSRPPLSPVCFPSPAKRPPPSPAHANKRPRHNVNTSPLKVPIPSPSSPAGVSSIPLSTAAPLSPLSCSLHCGEALPEELAHSIAHSFDRPLSPAQYGELISSLDSLLDKCYSLTCNSDFQSSYNLALHQAYGAATIWNTQLEEDVKQLHHENKELRDKLGKAGNELRESNLLNRIMKAELEGRQTRPSVWESMQMDYSRINEETNRQSVDVASLHRYYTELISANAEAFWKQAQVAQEEREKFINSVRKNAELKQNMFEQGKRAAEEKLREMQKQLAAAHETIRALERKARPTASIR